RQTALHELERRGPPARPCRASACATEPPPAVAAKGARHRRAEGAGETAEPPLPEGERLRSRPTADRERRQGAGDHANGDGRPARGLHPEDRAEPGRRIALRLRPTDPAGVL